MSCQYFRRNAIIRTACALGAVRGNSLLSRPDIITVLVITSQHSDVASLILCITPEHVPAKSPSLSQLRADAKLTHPDRASLVTLPSQPSTGPTLNLSTFAAPVGSQHELAHYHSGIVVISQTQLACEPVFTSLIRSYTLHTHQLHELLNLQKLQLHTVAQLTPFQSTHDRTLKAEPD